MGWSFLEDVLLEVHLDFADEVEGGGFELVLLEGSEGGRGALAGVLGEAHILGELELEHAGPVLEALLHLLQLAGHGLAVGGVLPGGGHPVPGLRLEALGPDGLLLLGLQRGLLDLLLDELDELVELLLLDLLQLHLEERGLLRDLVVLDEVVQVPADVLQRGALVLLLGFFLVLPALLQEADVLQDHRVLEDQLRLAQPSFVVVVRLQGVDRRRPLAHDPLRRPRGVVPVVLLDQLRDSVVLQLPLLVVVLVQDLRLGLHEDPCDVRVELENLIG